MKHIYFIHDSPHDVMLSEYKPPKFQLRLIVVSLFFFGIAAGAVVWWVR